MVTTRDKQRERWNLIMDAVVSTYRDTGEPVSSGHIAEHGGLGLSAATIRSVMKDLEEAGYLSQPHTSAGRVPTVKGYRYFVGNLMSEPALHQHEKHRIRELVEQVARENDAGLFMDHIASVLSDVTDLVGVAMTPLFDRSVFDRLEIVRLGGSRYLLVISLRNGLVRTINLTLTEMLPRAAVEGTARLLTGRLGGLTIAEIKRTIGERIRHAGGDRSLVDVILNRREQIFTSPEESDVHVAGFSRLLGLPEFTDPETSHRLVGLSENRLKISDAFRHTVSRSGENERFSIDIGIPGLLNESPPLSIVAATCLSAHTPGILGVIGPTRINYAHVMAVIRYTVAMTNHMFS